MSVFLRFYADKLKGKILLKSNKRIFLKNKESARDFILSRLSYHNNFYNFKFNSVRIKNTKSRWGSCSTKKNLNFNYKLIFLPKELADYVIVHELCHLKQFNHSRAFWELVSKAIPDYKELRIKLLNDYLHVR